MLAKNHLMLAIAEMVVNQLPYRCEDDVRITECHVGARRNGKNEIQFLVIQGGRQVVFTISDDGIDQSEVQSAAAAKGT